MTPISSLLEIEQLVARGEGEQVEFKASTGQRGEGAKTACGMLNRSGGFVVYGVEDGGRVVGQQVTGDTLEGVVRELRRIEPHVPLAPETVPLPNGRSVVMVRVPKGSGPYTYDGRAYIRLGPTTSLMSVDEYEHLLLERRQPAHRWEVQPAHGVAVADLDAGEIVRTVDEAVRRQRMEEPGTRNLDDLLMGLGLVRNGAILNAAGVLFGRRDRLLLLYPQCSLRLADHRTSGGEDDRQMGNAFDLLQRAQRFLRDSLPVAGRVVPGLYEGVDDPMYPPAALREALVNAFCHRDYSFPAGSVGVSIFHDRLEISSTGQLRHGVRPEDLLVAHPSNPANPAIASVFYRRGFIESWGRGTLKIGELTQRAGLLRPEFEERAGEVVVRFLPTSYVPPTRVPHELTALQREILLALADHGPASSVKLQQRLEGEISNRKVLMDLNHLRHLGLVERAGATRGAVWRLVGQRSAMSMVWDHFGITG
jgi:ATP-dependent DNA helicase RecG